MKILLKIQIIPGRSSYAQKTIVESLHPKINPKTKFKCWNLKSKWAVPCFFSHFRGGGASDGVSNATHRTLKSYAPSPSRIRVAVRKLRSNLAEKHTAIPSNCGRRSATHLPRAQTQIILLPAEPPIGRSEKNLRRCNTRGTFAAKRAPRTFAGATCAPY
jgi:hypothetical protein